MKHRFHSILFVASFLMSLASGIENYALIFYVRDLFHADKTAIGLISSAFDLAYLGGILAFLAWKKPHPRGVLWFAAWAMAASIAVYLLAPDWTVTFVFHAAFGLAMALFWPRIMGWLSWGVEGRELAQTMGRFNFSWAFGGILAPWVGGLMVEADLRLPFWTAVGLLTLLGLLMPLGSRLFPEFRRPQDPPAAAKTGVGPAGAAEAAPLRPSDLRLPGRLGIGGAYFLLGVLLFIFPAYAKESLGFSESLSGSFLLVRLAVATLGFGLWGRWPFWHERFWPLAVGMSALGGLTLAFLAGSQAWHFALLFAAVGLVFSFLYSYALFHGVAGSANRERSMTIHEAVLNLGLFAGTLLGGWVSQTWSMGTAFGLVAVVTGALLTLQVVLRGRQVWRR